MDYLDYFKELCLIPHGSGNTDAISKYLTDFATQNNLRYKKDAFNNVIIIREASETKMSEEPWIIQGHMDMVAVSDSSDFDMTRNGLNVLEDDDYLWAESTSLGADDGIAVAYALALLASKEELPRIEFICTVDEEVGMLGASYIDLSCIKGKRMLNIDSEEEGVFIVGCAGGVRIDYDFGLSCVKADESCLLYEMNIDGLIGGHSGTEINKGRANAIVIAIRIMNELCSMKYLEGITAFFGGKADNVICNSCKVVFVCNKECDNIFDKIANEVMDEYKSVENNGRIRLRRVNMPCNQFYDLSDGKLLNLISTFQNGVIEMDSCNPGMVLTSANHGIVNLDNGILHLVISLRSNNENCKKQLLDRFMNVSDVPDVSVTTRGDYPGWDYNPDSKLRDKMVSVYKKLYNKEPQVMTLHAGLECGIILRKIPNLDCVSFGPDIYDIHTTKEKLDKKSAQRVWEFINHLIVD